MSAPTPFKYTGFVYGLMAMPVPEIRGLPSGKVRMRFKIDDYARVFVRTQTGVKQFFLINHGDHWEALERGENFRSLDGDIQRDWPSPQRAEAAFNQRLNEKRRQSKA